MAAALGGEYAQELRALKLELQATIARLSGECSPSLSGRHGFQSPPLRVETAVAVTNEDIEPHHTTARAAGTPATTVSTAASSADDAGGENRERIVPANSSEHVEECQDRGTDARVVLRELTRAARRREQLERQLLDEVQQDNRDGQDVMHREDQRRHHRRRHSSRKRHERKRGIRALHHAIEELQRQRQEILRQIDAETAVDHKRAGIDANRQANSKCNSSRRTESEPSALQGGHHQTHMAAHAAVAGNDATSDSQYSIGGIVTLEPLQVAGPTDGRAARFSGGLYPQLNAELHARPQPPPSYAPRVVYPKTLDALNDVFSIQLKFAETMLQLEQSVQVRDQLLHGRPSTHRHHRRRRPDSSFRGNPKQLDTSQDGILDSGIALSSSSDDDGDLAGSDASTVDYGRRQHRRRNRQLSTESSQQVSTPSSSADTARNASSINSMAVTASVSARTSPSVLESSRTSSPEHGTPVAVRKPSGAADLTTPSTGSSKKSDASSKQVRFGDDEFSTPLIARKFSFGSSDDDDDHEDTPGGGHIDDVEGELSVLSLLEGSSVHSSELNDASFLRAFDEFRRELKTECPVRLTGSTGASSSAARALLKTLNTFVTPEKAKPTAAGGSQIQEIDDREERADESVRSHVRTNTGVSRQGPTETPETQCASHATSPPANETELVERRRQLCLDIQAESATLALSFAADERQADTIRAKLRALRDELSAVEAQLAA